MDFTVRILFAHSWGWDKRGTKKVEKDNAEQVWSDLQLTALVPFFLNYFF